jgi:hypothetical protein
MKTSVETCKKMMSSRLEGLRGLNQSLIQSRQALLSRDAEGLLQLTAQQEVLCGEVDFLDAEIESVRVELHSELEADDVERIAIAEQIASAEAELVKAYKVNAGLLRRARRAVNVMINVAQSEANAYCSPSSYRALQLGEE